MLHDQPCPSQASRLAFKERYLARLLPVLVGIHARASLLTIEERLKAIKFAADMSLALTAGDLSWSRALSEQLCLQSKGGNAKLEDDGCPRGNRLSLSSSADICENGGLDLRSGYQQRLGTVAMRDHHHRCYRVCRKLLFLRRLRRRFVVRDRLKRAKYGKALRSCIPRPSRHPQSRRPHMQTFFSDCQITSLRQIIPGGGQMDAPLLLKEAADYIISLQIQIEALETLACTASMSM